MNQQKAGSRPAVTATSVFVACAVFVTSNADAQTPPTTQTAAPQLAPQTVSQTVPQPAPPKRIPPPGIEVPAADRAALTDGLADLRREIAATAKEIASEPRYLGRLPDVEIYHKAVDWALRYNEFFTPQEIAFAKQMLSEGRERALQLRERKTPWLDATGLVLRGYRSKLDGSIQPYGLVVPEGARGAKNRLMVWCLGRGEKRTEIAFLMERKGKAPEVTPKNTLILVPYGRFCNATKFAGEADVFEALDALRGDYQIDAARTMVAGFSMGGGSTWHLATHYSGLWCAAAPGAGFAETPVFSNALAPGKTPRPWWEQKLWAWYDATGYAANLFNVPTVAYSGELDRQKQAADIMTEAMAKEGLALQHFIGPQTQHKYHPETKEALTRRLEELLDKGRESLPREVRLTTYTLRYPQSAWVRIEGIKQHWERSDVKAKLENNSIVADTKNVTHLSFPGVQPTRVILDGQSFEKLPQGALRFARDKEKWRVVKANEKESPRKRPGLTGPIDDAWMEPFLFVRPTGKPLNETVGKWATDELAQAVALWRDVYRGDVTVKDDTALGDDDLATKNIVLWGDPSSNVVLAKMVKRLPLKWDAKKLIFRGKSYDAAHHAPIFIFPNPLNPQRYVVINSGLDFRADGYGSNALQTPKLPDWAVVDLREAPGPRWPGLIADAGFFNEEWE
jgi:pimeloyl-ACP methyl ester carboxylesterase